MTEFERWLGAFDAAWRAPENLAKLECPACGHRCLILVYVVDGVDDTQGVSSFWCGQCLRGLPPQVGALPDGLAGTLRREAEVPNYRLVVDE
ncbi:hypothetical protein [Kribbella swartbergensis]